MQTDDPPTEAPSGWDALASFVEGQTKLGWGFLLLLVLALSALTQLQFEFSPQTLFDTSSEEAQIYRDYRAEFGADDHVIMALVEADLRRATTWVQLKQLEERVRSQVAEVERVDGLFSLPIPQSDGVGQVRIEPWLTELPRNDSEAETLLRRTADHPLLGNLFVSKDGQAAAILIKVEDDVAKLSAVRPVVAQLRAIADGVESSQEGLRIHLLGPHTYRVAVVGIMVREELRFLPLTGVVLALALFVLFRRWTGVAVPLLSVLLGALWTLAVMALTGEPVNIINTITATLILVIGVADAIHMMTRYAHERRSGVSRSEATRRTLRSVGAACFLTSFTTAVGFATLMTARLEILRHFGIYAAIGVLLTFGMTMVFVPWALVQWKRDPLPVEPRDLEGPETESRNFLDPLLGRLAHAVCARPRTTILLCVATASLLCSGAHRTRVDNFIMEYVPRDAELLEAHRLLEEKLAGIVFIDTLLELPPEAPEGAWLEPERLAQAAELEESFRQEDGIHNVDSILTLLREIRFVQRGGEGGTSVRSTLPESRAEAAQLLLLAELGGAPTLGSHWRTDGRFLRLTARAADLGARNYLALEERMKANAAEIFGDGPFPVDVRITGTSQVGYGGIDSLIRDLLTSLAWAFGLIFLTLCLLFRSVPLAALAMGPNVLPVLVVLGTMGWMDRHLETLSAMVFSIGLGIAVDDTIHFLARYCEEIRQGRTPEEAVVRTTEQTGRAIVHTSLLLLVGFGVLMTSSFPPNRSFAVLAGAVITTALVADLTLLPALLVWLRPRVPARRRGGGKA